MKVLFVKESLLWPRASGHDVHCFHMMQALSRIGIEVSLLTGLRCLPKSVENAGLQSQWIFSDLERAETPVQLTRLQGKFCSYWGTNKDRISQISDLVKSQNFNAVVVVGLDVLPYLASLPATVHRIWYAADEWFLHHWSQIKFGNPNTWSELKFGLIKGLYEYAFKRCTDRVWVVSSKDASAIRWVMPRSAVDVIANGVDADHFHAASVDIEPSAIDSQGLVFWGRLDFGPNLDAIQWFCQNVWTRLRRTRPEIRWTVYGFQAGTAVRSLAEKYEFDLVPDLPDLRSEILKHRVVVLPFVSGAGIKNKFLEAAAMSRPIVASRRALNGVDLKGGQPCLVAQSADQWISHISRLIDDAEERAGLGQRARDWVVKNYSWDHAGALAMKSLAAPAVRAAPVEHDV